MTHAGRRNLPARTSVEVRMVIRQQIPAIAALAIALLAGCTTGSPGSTPSTTPVATRPTSPVPSSGVTPVPTRVTSRPVRVSSPAQAAALVFASDPRFGSVGEDGPGRVEESSSYQASENGDGYSVSITMGSGDCQSSCTNQHTWNYSVSRAAVIQLVSEQGDKLDVPIEQGTNDPAEVTVRLRAGPVCPVERNPPDPSCA